MYNRFEELLSGVEVNGIIKLNQGVIKIKRYGVVLGFIMLFIATIMGIEKGLEKHIKINATVIDDEINEGINENYYYVKVGEGIELEKESTEKYEEIINKSKKQLEEKLGQPKYLIDYIKNEGTEKEYSGQIMGYNLKDKTSVLGIDIKGKRAKSYKEEHSLMIDIPVIDVWIKGLKENSNENVKEEEDIYSDSYLLNKNEEATPILNDADISNKSIYQLKNNSDIIPYYYIQYFRSKSSNISFEYNVFVYKKESLDKAQYVVFKNNKLITYCEGDLVDMGFDQVKKLIQEVYIK